MNEHDDHRNRPPPPPAPVPWPESPDHALMAKIAQGDDRAMHELWRAHQGRLLKFAKKCTKNEATAKDLTQEAWLKLWKAAPRWQPTGSVLAWLCEVVRREAIALGEKRELAEAAEALEPRTTPEAAAEGRAAPSVVTQLAAARTHFEVRAALASLPAPQREALELTYFDHLTAAEAAAKLQIPQKTFESRVQLGAKKLHARLTTIYAARRRPEDSPEGDEE